MDQVNSIERTFASHKLTIPHPKDVESALQARPASTASEDDNECFKIDPYVDWNVWRGATADLELDRGPRKLSFPTCFCKLGSTYPVLKPAICFCAIR